MLAGCGGGGGPSREAFAQQADGICGPAIARLRAVERRLGAAGSKADPDAIYAESAALWRERVAISRQAFTRIEALEDPAEGTDQVDAWIAANRTQAVLGERLATAFDAQDQTRIARLSEQVDSMDERNAATAGALGMRVCAERVRS